MQRFSAPSSVGIRKPHRFSAAMLTPDTDTVPDVIDLTDIEAEHEPRYRILIHNDDVTPFPFVMVVLRRIFKLSREIAEHVTLGVKVVASY